MNAPPLQRPAGRYDVTMFAAAAILLAIGSVLVFSATTRVTIEAASRIDRYYFLWRQLVNVGMGALLFVAAVQMPRRLLLIVARTLLPVSIVLLLLVLIPGIGMAKLGARRWLDLGVFTLQPSEFAKVGFALYLASYLAKRRTVMRDLFAGVLPLFVMFVVVAFLLARQPDVGSAVLLGMLALVMLIVGGTRLTFLGFGFGLFAVGLMLVILSQPEKLARLVGWLMPDQTRMGEGYQVFNSQILIGSGGLFGSGLGQGLNHQLGYLPQSETDFIFSVAAEELGFVGVVLIVALYAVIAVRGFQLARICRDDFSRFAAFFLTLILTLPAVIHMGVGLGLLPTKGLVCPFLSYGGSAMMATLLTLGLLQRLHLEATTGLVDDKEGTV